MVKYRFSYQTPIGRIGIAEERQKITNLWLPGEPGPEHVEENETPVLAEAFQQLSQYLNGERKEFTVPLAPSGTPFQMKVWDCLRTIPYGQTRSYGKVASLIGSPKAARAVGMANNRNPIAVFVPCHRVIGSNGKLVGYAGGLDLKERLLEIEKEHSG
jgi:methylated-DNA-[protein]-cysteine S-methyltransferase